MAHQLEVKRRALEATLQGEQHRRLRSAEEAAGKLRGIERLIHSLEAALASDGTMAVAAHGAHTGPMPDGRTPLPLLGLLEHASQAEVELVAEEERCEMAIHEHGALPAASAKAFHEWCAHPSRCLPPQDTPLVQWVTDVAVEAVDAAFQAARVDPLNPGGIEVEALPREVPAAPQAICAIRHVHFASLWRDSRWRVSLFGLGGVLEACGSKEVAPEEHKLAVMRQVWQLQAVLDCNHAILGAADTGPWKLTRVIDAHGDSSTVVKAVRRHGETIQERAVMLLPKPSLKAAESSRLTPRDERALERVTMLGDIRCASLPALESDCGVTPDKRLGWRFMESLGEEVTTLEEGGVAEGEDDSVPKRCYRAIKMGLQLLSALRPLHARRLVHAALAPKHVAKVYEGKEVQYKLLGLGDLHLFGEASHARLVPGVREYASPEAKIASHPLDASADLYAVGMMLFASVAEDGRPPHIDLEASEPPDLMQAAEGVDTHLADVLLKALHPDPAQRYRDIDEMEHALRDCALQQGDTWCAPAAHAHLLPATRKTRSAAPVVPLTSDAYPREPLSAPPAGITSFSLTASSLMQGSCARCTMPCVGGSSSRRG